jgi:hypothetical protein
MPPNFAPLLVIFLACLIVIQAGPIWRKYFDFQPLSQLNHSDNPPKYPDLLHADAEDLVAGLESGRWTSVDLVKVDC